VIFAGVFRRFRKKRKLSQAEMADLFEMSQSRISKIESGLLEPGVWDFVKIYREADPIEGMELDSILQGTWVEPEDPPDEEDDSEE
jgi:transcriptional regulator with XRE-family HTH domain